MAKKKKKYLNKKQEQTIANLRKELGTGDYKVDEFKNKHKATFYKNLGRYSKRTPIVSVMLYRNGKYKITKN